MNDRTTPLLQVFKADRRRWFSLAGSKAKLPEAAPEFDFFTVSGPSASRELGRVSRADAVKALGRDENSVVLVLKKAPGDCAFSFTGVVKDEQGNGWDLLLNGSCSITDIRAFMGKYGFDSVTVETPVSSAVLESWMAHTVQHQVKDAVRGVSVSDLREKDALPALWWEAQFNKWFSPAGLACKVTAARWASADGARAEAERAREREMERIAQERDRQLQAEIREVKAKTDYEKEKGRIEADKQLSESERTHQLQVLELRHRKELLAAETEIENARRAAEQSALEHELAVARLRKDLESVSKAETRIAESREEHTALAASLAKTAELLDRLNRASEPLLQRLAGKDLQKSNAAAERLVSPEFGFTASQLLGLGFSVPNQALVASLSTKHGTGGKAVELVKEDLTEKIIKTLGTRDIGVAKVKALPIGHSLQFKLVSHRVGYVSLLNLGTSGAVYLHVPNAMIGGQNVRIVEDKPYFVPGQELFPWEWDYREEGPAGWEHIVGIVSDEPVIPGEIVGRSTAEAPIVRLTAEEVGVLFAKLEDMPADTWSSGVLSFLVG